MESKTNFLDNDTSEFYAESIHSEFYVEPNRFPQGLVRLKSDWGELEEIKSLTI